MQNLLTERTSLHVGQQIRVTQWIRNLERTNARKTKSMAEPVQPKEQDSQTYQTSKQEHPIIPKSVPSFKDNLRELRAVESASDSPASGKTWEMESLPNKKEIRTIGQKEDSSMINHLHRQIENQESEGAEDSPWTEHRPRQKEELDHHHQQIQKLIRVSKKDGYMEKDGAR